MLPNTSRNCTLCGSDKKKTHFDARVPTNGSQQDIHYMYSNEQTANTWHYRLIDCLDCGHQYADPIFDSKTIEGSYLQQEHDNQFGIDPKLLYKTQRGYADIVRPYLSQKRDLQVDIGCDTGLFLSATREFGYRRVVGIEPGLESAEKASKIDGVEVMRKIFDPSDFAEGSIDLVSMIHVLDHLVDSKKFVRDLKPRMAKGGIVLGVVHNIQSIIAKITGESWPPLNLIHMDYFAPETLRRLFESEGYRVVAVKSTKNYFPMSHLIRMSPFPSKGIRAKMIQAVEKTPFNSVPFGLWLGNIAVVARVE